MTSHQLYAYGTLQVPAIAEHILGRAVEGHPAILDGYVRFRMRDRVYPAIVEHLDGRVEGLLYAGLSSSELHKLDRYEGEFYERRAVAVMARSFAAAPIQAHTYVLRAEHGGELSGEPWSLDEFVEQHLSSYLKQVKVTSKAP